MYSISDQVLWGWTSYHLLFSFLLHNWRSISSQDLFWILPALPNVSIQRNVSDKNVKELCFPLGRWGRTDTAFIKSRPYMVILAVVLHLVMLLLNWTCRLNCFLDFIEVSRNLFSMQLNATDGGQNPVTFGINEIAGLLNSQVKYVFVQCLIVLRRLLESLVYVRLFQSLGRFLEQLCIMLCFKIT